MLNRRSEGMEVRIFKNKQEMAQAAAFQAATALRTAIERNSQACFIAATGASQFEFLDILTATNSLDWSKTKMFHLDEYVGLPDQHPASFRKYLRERLIDKVHPGEVYLLAGDAPDPEAEAHRVSDLISRCTTDVAFVGVGENGHLAFNDPPADFETDKPYIVVDLDTKCRQQQVNEGWFSNIPNVPSKAITMSINQIMKSKIIIAVVPGTRKAEAIKNCFGNAEISPNFPSSILKQHPNAVLYLDKDSASLLNEN
jgi:glucosamine-6-phosphate deaminase